MKLKQGDTVYWLLHLNIPKLGEIKEYRKCTIHSDPQQTSASLIVVKYDDAFYTVKDINLLTVQEYRQRKLKNLLD